MEVEQAPVDVDMTSSTVDEDMQTLSVKEQSSYVTYPAVADSYTSYPLAASAGNASCFLQSSSDLSPGDIFSSSSSSSSAAVKSPATILTSVDGDSAYMTQPASMPSTPSSVSVSPVSWTHDWRGRPDDNDDNDDDDDDDDDKGRQEALQRTEKVKRKSWAAGQSERYCQYHHHRLRQSESWHDISQPATTTTTTTDDSDKFVVPTITPVMLSLSASARRRLGKKRDVSVTSSSATTNDSSSSTTTTTTSSVGGGFELRRTPSSLFYLEYDNDDTDDDDDNDDDAAAKRRRKMQRYSDLPSSRKISAAAYLPAQLTSPTVSPTDESAPHQQQQQQQQQGAGHGDNDEARRATVAKRRRGVSRQNVAVTTIDEILRRQDSSLQQYYKDTLRQIDAVTKVFRLNDDMYRQLMVVLNAEMDRGLQRATHHDATVKMFHTYVRALPTGSESGRYVALDLGGTNFRVLLVQLKGRRDESPDVVSKVFLIPLKIMLGTAQMLFDHIVSCIAEFLEELSLKDKQFTLGFTFSFPCKQLSLASATLVKWTKGFKCSGVENQDVVSLLHDAIQRRQDLAVECVAIINDNVGVLMAGAHSDPNCRIGLILGTGTNCCYLEDLDKVELWSGDRDEPRQMVVNTEWGAFGDDGQLEFVRSEFDRQLDEQSLNPQHQLFEKMISGMYMGEIVRLVLCELTMQGLLFNRQLSEQLFEPQRFYTKYISEIESDDPAGDYPNTRLVLQELCISDVTLDDCRHVQHVCWQVSQRAAHLAATAAAVVIQRVGLNDVTVAVDGSLYRFHPHFKQLMSSKISQLLPPHLQFKTTLAHDGSGQGAALVAATASRRQHVAATDLE